MFTHKVSSCTSSSNSKIWSCKVPVLSIPWADTKSQLFVIFFIFPTEVHLLWVPVLTAEKSKLNTQGILIGMSRAKPQAEDGCNKYILISELFYDAMKLVYVTR